MKYRRKTIDRRDVNLLLICLAITSMFAIRYALENMAAKANEILSPMSDQPAIMTETVIVEKHIIKPIDCNSQKCEVMAYTLEVFQDDAPDAFKIAQCESGFDPNRVGDQHLMVENNGEIVGDSIGVFQIRTGGAGWNRAKANDMSAVDFRAKLTDYKYNIDYAKTIYDQRGWSAWFNCMTKTGVK